MGVFSNKIGPRIGILDSTGMEMTGKVPELLSRSVFFSRKREEMKLVTPVPKMLMATPLTIWSTLKRIDRKA